LARHNDIGKQGEDLAAQHLHQQGYEILARNWRYRRAEVDIIARDGAIVVFVEVKAKSYDYYGDPAESVDAKKEEFMAHAAGAYCEEIGHEWEIRFDIISVVIGNDDKVTLDHYKDAFFPGMH
jgi:putative endonuclease